MQLSAEGLLTPCSEGHLFELSMKGYSSTNVEFRRFMYSQNPNAYCCKVMLKYVCKWFGYAISLLWIHRFCCGTLLKEFTLLIESTLICLNEGPESKITEGT